jgi:hypothetical protein
MDSVSATAMLIKMPSARSEAYRIWMLLVIGVFLPEASSLKGPDLTMTADIKRVKLAR